MQRYYHISKTDLGEKFRFTPRVPRSAIIDDEGDIPRVCVSSKIVNCIDAICGCYATVNDFIHEVVRLDSDLLIPPTVYFTTRTPYTPPNAVDFYQNGEKWFITSVTMKRLGYIDLERMFQFGEVLITQQFKPTMMPNEEHQLYEYIRNVVTFVKS